MARLVPSLDTCKRDASLLLKDLRSNDATAAERAANRFRRIHPFKEREARAVIEQRETVQHKHALDVVAREHGFLNWKKLKDAADVLWCPLGTSAFWHIWCKSHEEAKSFQQEKGGFILRGHGTCFLAEPGYIEALGLDPADPRWEQIGYDVIAPADTAMRDGIEADLAAIQIAGKPS